MVAQVRNSQQSSGKSSNRNQSAPHRQYLSIEHFPVPSSGRRPSAWNSQPPQDSYNGNNLYEYGEVDSLLAFNTYYKVSRSGTMERTHSYMYDLGQHSSEPSIVSNLVNQLLELSTQD